MGYAIAEALAQQGASVILISGPTELQAEHPNITTERVTSAQEMHDACKDNFPACNGAVLVAAVADFTPSDPSEQKMKKTESQDQLTLTLKKTPDILSALGSRKAQSQFLTGFSLETENVIKNSREKLHNKNLDFIVINELNVDNQVFGSDHNQVSILDKDGVIFNFGVKKKTELAQDIVQFLAQFIEKEQLWSEPTS